MYAEHTMIIGYIGNIGSGKTLSMVRDAYILYRRGFTIYSNIVLSFPYKTFSLKDLIEYAKNKQKFYKAVFLLDEAHLIGLDSRTSASKINRYMSYWILMSRKADIIIMFTTQFIHQIDKRLRATTDCVIECYCKNFQDNLFVMNRRNRILINGIRTRNYIFHANKFFKLYDTREIVNSLDEVEWA